MIKKYHPKSDFLKNFDAETVPLGGHEFGIANLRRLIRLMHDEDDSNRDWATFLAGMSEVHTQELNAAFLKNTQDENYDVRCEAILALAKRNATEALKIVEAALLEQSVSVLVIEAAGYVADKSLAPVLEEIESWWGENEVVLEEAIKACKKGERIYFEWP